MVLASSPLNTHSPIQMSPSSPTGFHNLSGIFEARRRCRLDIPLSCENSSLIGAGGVDVADETVYRNEPCNNLIYERDIA